MTSIPENQTGKIFTFAEIVHGRESSVRVTDDGLLYAVDLAMVVTGKDRDHAGQALRSISNDIFHSLNFSERQLSTRGGPKTKLVSLQHAIELVMVLPGKVAKETRVQFAEIIKRYIAGDQTLITEINANAASTSPIAQLAQASVDQDCDAGVKRRCEGLGGKQKIQDVSWAFDYQKEALELRHKRDLQLLENDYNEEIIEMEEKNDLLRKENAEAIEYIEKLKKELEILKQEDQEIMAQYNESMEHVRIWGSPYLHQLELKNTP
jgi:hypothetical protein